MKTASECIKQLEKLKETQFYKEKPLFQKDIKDTIENLKRLEQIETPVRKLTKEKLKAMQKFINERY